MRITEAFDTFDQVVYELRQKYTPFSFAKFEKYK